MADILLSPMLHLVLFIGAVVFAAITARRQKLLWSVLAAVCAICACLLGLAANRSLEQLLLAVLMPLAVILLSQAKTKGGSGT